MVSQPDASQDARTLAARLDAIEALLKKLSENPIVNADTILTVPQFAKWIGVHRRTVERWCRLGMPRIAKSKTFTRIHYGDALAWLKKRKPR